MATIGDVAELAGVSIATVSRVVNARGRVLDATRERVLRAVAELDYHPNRAAQHLRSGMTGIVLILTPNMTNPYYASILTGIGDTATARGYSAFTCITDEDAARARDALEMLKHQRADGAIMLCSNGDPSLASDFAASYPVIECSEHEPDTDVTHVSIDNYQAALDVMEHLADLGHERIGHISAANPYLSTAERLRGYRDALKARGIRYRAQYVEQGSADYSFASGKAAAGRLLALPEPPTALFCISDTLAMGAEVAALERGLRVPADVSVTGFDDVQATMLHPYLTSLSQPCHKLGSTSMEVLLELIGGEHPEKEIVLSHRLVVRESTAPNQKGTK
ncbi:MAG: LacI family transcriptional regulator [Propionibacteriaceae bacterium]|jgi:DNA-binding LacI/PurR family transcriptional regulator|nr:LacI family transcriptional regulator [Propionibacteriaceae bacterium]